MLKPRTGLAYAFVAGVCYLLHNAVMIATNWAGAPLWASVCASFALVAVAGYGLHSFLTFCQPLGWLRFGRYVLAMASNLPLSYVATWIWQKGLALPMLYAAPAASACLVVLNFGLSRWAIAHRPSTGDAA